MPIAKFLTTTWRGISGLTRSAAGIGLTDEQSIADRRRQCALCAHATGRKKTPMRGLKLLSPTSRCAICRCSIHAKTRLADERCPLGRW
jgi:hypothetical protein